MGNDTLTFDKNAYYRKYMKEYYADPIKRDARNVRQRAARLAHPERTMFNKAKARAKEMGRSFDITVEDIVIPEVCPLLGIPLFSSEKHVTSNSPVLDRRDNLKGYVKGNVCVISHRANTMKNDITIDQLHRLLEYMT